MGRLQKKKTAVEKTKRRIKIKQRTESSEVSSNGDVSASNGALAQKSVPRAGVPKESKIKLVQSSAKKGPVPSKLSELSQGDNFVSRSIEFLREVKFELNKVTWPTRQQTIASTIVVIILVIIMSLFLGLVDMSLSKIIEVLLH